MQNKEAARSSGGKEDNGKYYPLQQAVGKWEETNKPICTNYVTCNLVICDQD